jgi:PRTRC genetic system protein B
MFFRHDDPLGAVGGRSFPQPALVFKVSSNELWIRALAADKRPTADTAMMVAPYYNVNAEGLVCQGSMRSPSEASVASMLQWEQSFFDSEFTHIYGGGHFTRHAESLVDLWMKLASAARFPTRTLVPTDETLAQFVERVR